jgi:multiple sugar transport system substrate-binding protein
MKLLFKKLLGIFVPFMLLASGPVHAGKFDGITIRVLSRPGPVISGAVDMRGKKFTELTGAKVIVLELPFSELFNKVLTDWSQGTNSIDAAVTSSAWVPELVDMGLVADLSDFVANDPGLKLDDITEYFREFNQKVNGKTYTLTLDGDFHMFYYRTDVLNRFSQEPPTTWDEWFEVAKAIHGKDYNGDGEPDYASCAFKKRATQSYFTVWSVASAFIQTKGTSQGVFFDTKTGKPSLPNPGFAEGLRVYKEMGKYGPADELNMDIADIRALYLAGRCAMVIEWGDTSPLALESDTVRNLWGASQMLGSTRVWNRDTNRLEQCNPTLCPHAINGVNHAPFGAFGGWSAYINKNADPKVIQAAYEFFSYMNAPEQSNIDVTQGWTGFNPYRTSQFEDIDNWLEAGFTRASAAAYLNGMKQSLSNPNFVSDLRIPGAAQYTSVILDTEIARYLAGEINEEQTMANIAEAWEEVTEDFGREKQMKLYRATLGLKAHY